MKEYRTLTIEEHIKIIEKDIHWAERKIKDLKILLEKQEQSLKDLKKE